MPAAADVVNALEQRFLPQLEEATTRLRERYPRLKINTYSSSVGSLTEYQGHDIGIDCLNPAAPDDAPDNVALSIGVKHLTTQPLLCTADVCWGAEGPAGGLDVLPEPGPWTPAALQAAEARLPDLIDSLETELEFLDGLGRTGA